MKGNKMLLINPKDGSVTGITGPTCTIGRDGQSDIVVSGRNISRNHCIIQRIAGMILVKDLFSQAGTFVNKREVDPYGPPKVLADGDVLYIGPFWCRHTTTFTIEISDEKAPLLLCHDPSLDREELKAEREAEHIAARQLEAELQVWLDKLKGLTSFSETTAMIDGWFEAFKQRKAELATIHAQFDRVHSELDYYQREWCEVSQEFKEVRDDAVERRNLIGALNIIQHHQAGLKEERSELHQRINELKALDLPSWDVAKELAALNRACLKAYVRSWLDDSVWSGIDEIVVFQVSEQDSTREKADKVASYEVQLTKAFEELEFLDEDFWVQMAGDLVVAAEVFRQVQVALKYRRGQLIRARKQRYGLYFETNRKWQLLHNRVSEIKKRMLSTASSIQRSQWQHQYSRLYNTLKKKVLLDEGNNEALKEELKIATSVLAEVVFNRGKTVGEQSTTSFTDLSALNMKFRQIGKDDLLVDFNDSSNGRMTTGLSVIAKALGEPDMIHQVRVWNFDRTALVKEARDSQELWKAVAMICIQYGYVCIANNGSRMLIRVQENGQATKLAKFLDSLFEDFSQIGAYGLGLLNATPVSMIGGPHDKPINSRVDEAGRETKVILFNSWLVGLIPGTDGAGLNNFGYYGQHRSFAIKEGVAAFFKGMSVSARFTLLDGVIHRVNDLVNVAYLGEEELEAYLGEEFVEEVKAWKEAAKTQLSRQDEIKVSKDLQEVLDERGNYLFIGSRKKESDHRKSRWDQWFDDNPHLPYVFGQDIGQLKGLGKKTLGALASSLGEVTYKKVGKKVSLDESSNGEYTPKDAEEYLQAWNGCIVVDAPVFGWSVVDAPQKSSTSMNFQPAAPLMAPAFVGEAYDELIEKFIDRFSDRSDHSKVAILDKILSGITGGKHTVKYPSAFVKNTLADFSRFYTNTSKTKCPTRRIVMEDKGYRGFVIIEEGNGNLYFEVDGQRVRFPVAMAAWRSPLIVPSALQAPLALDRGLILDLLRALGKEASGRSFREREILKLVLERLMFKQEKSEEQALKHLPGMLEGMLEIAELIKIDNTIIIMDVSDVEDMQGDDDGDNVTVDFDEDFVKLCQDTERFWRKFYEANNLRPIKIEMTKANQIKFGKANGIYNGAPFDTEQAKFVELFGVECPLVANAYDMGGTKIPSPLGLNCQRLIEINKKTEGKLFDDPDSLWTILFKLGSSPLGPVGASSNGSPDLLIRALAQTDENFVLNEYGRRLWQAYSTLGSTVQVSIDWAKRVYDILCMIMYDQKKENGSWLIDFESEITPEKAEDYLVKNTFDKVNFVTFKLVRKPKNTKKTITQGSKMLRVVVSDDGRYELLRLDDGNSIVDADSTKIYRVGSEEEIDKLEATKEIKVDYDEEYHLTNKVKRIRLMDKANACFDQDSIFAVGGFMIQPPLQGFNISEGGVVHGWGSIEKLAAFKKDIKDILKLKQVEGQGYIFAKDGAAAYTALSRSYPGSFLVRNTTNFMDYFLNSMNSGDARIKEILDYPDKIQAAAKESSAGKQLDNLWNKVSPAIAVFFKNKKRDGEDLKRNQVLRLVYDVIGIDRTQVEVMLTDLNKEIVVGDLKFTCIDLIAMLFRNDPAVGDENKPQCTAQMLISEVLEKNEENLFDDLATSLESTVKKRFFDRFAPFSNKNGVKSLISPTRLSKYIKDKRFEGLSYLLEGLFMRDPDGKFNWVSPQHCFEGLARIFEHDKNSILNCAHFEKDVLRVLKSELYSGDAELVARDFISTIKIALVSCDQWIRKLRGFSKVSQFPTRLFDSRGLFNEKWATSQDTLHPENLFVSKFLAVDSILTNLIKQLPLPDAQYSRTKQGQVIKELAKAGHPVRSFTFFGNTAIKYPDDIKLMYVLSGGPLPSLKQMKTPKKVNGDWTYVEVSDARARYFSLTSFNLLGVEVPKVIRVLASLNLVEANDDGSLKDSKLVDSLLKFDTPKLINSERQLVTLARPALEHLVSLGWTTSWVDENGPQYFRTIVFENLLAQFLEDPKPNDVIKLISKKSGIWEFDGNTYYNLDSLKQAIPARMVL